GKTVVALRAMLRAVDSGHQAALLAPTEVLAEQHHRTLTELLGDLAAAGRLDGHPDATRVRLLTGSQRTAARRETLLDVTSGQDGGGAAGDAASGGFRTPGGAAGTDRGPGRSASPDPDRAAGGPRRRRSPGRPPRRHPGAIAHRLPAHCRAPRDPPGRHLWAG